MEWTISFQSDIQIVIFSTKGIADKETTLEMANSIAKTMAQYKALRCLIDHSQLQAVSGNTIDIYYRPQEVGNIGVPLPVKIAEVVLPAHKEHFGFLETVFHNRGIQFSIYSDRESAIKWLME